ncbi:MAG: hypothetical protein ACLRMJ_03715 [Alistipes finegoldii]
MITAEGYISRRATCCSRCKPLRRRAHQPLRQHRQNLEQRRRTEHREPQYRPPKFSWTTTSPSPTTNRTWTTSAARISSRRSSPGNNPYMVYGYVSYPLNALWGFKWRHVEERQEFERNSVTNTYVSALAINSDAASRKASLGMPRYYDINNDGSLNNDDLVYQGNADPDLYGGLQNNFRFGRLNVGIYFTYSLGGKIYNYSELYMAGSSMSNQYRYMLEAWHPVRNPQSNLPRAPR